MSISSNPIAVDWRAGRYVPTFHAPHSLTVYNVRDLSYDLQLSIATLVGLINRSQTTIYLNWRTYDLFWLQTVFKHIPQTISPLTGEAILTTLLRRYHEQLAGYVIYDPACLDSVNIATMIGAQRNGVVVSPALADILRRAGCDFAVIDDLRKYTWRSRAHVYAWALQHLFAQTTPGIVAGLPPTIALGLRPYLVASKAFIYWLHPLDIVPRCGPGWLSERRVLKSILRACSLGTTHLGWFLQEGSGVTLTSQHAIPVVASDHCSNLEIWSSVTPSEDTLFKGPSQRQALALHVGDQRGKLPFGQAPIFGGTASPQPTLQPKVYISFTMSEGDNLQYVQERMIQHWRDPQRGSIPIGWPMAPMLSQAAPAMWDYYVRTASANDEFLAGPSGLGYCYPSKWPRQQLAAYLIQTGQAMQRMQLRLLEVLDSNFWLHPFLMYRAIKQGSAMIVQPKKVQQRLAHELQAFGLQGIFSGGGLARAYWRHYEDIPIVHNVGIANSVSQALALIRQAPPQRRPAFLNVYVLAWRMGPSELRKVAQELGSEYEIVLPSTLLNLLQFHHT